MNSKLRKSSQPISGLLEKPVAGSNKKTLHLHGGLVPAPEVVLCSGGWSRVTYWHERSRLPAPRSLRLLHSYQDLWSVHRGLTTGVIPCAMFDGGEGKVVSWSTVAISSF